MTKGKTKEPPRALAFVPRLDAVDEVLTPAMKRAARFGNNSDEVSARTVNALEARGLVTQRGKGRFHWTPRGWFAARKIKAGE